MNKSAIKRLASLGSAHTGDVVTLPGESGRAGEVVVVLVAETPQFVGSGLLVRPASGHTSFEDRVAVAMRLSKVLKEAVGDNLPPVPAFVPMIVHPYTRKAFGVVPGELHVPTYGGSLVHFAAGPPEKGRFF